jgi:outer membrane protein
LGAQTRYTLRECLDLALQANLTVRQAQVQLLIDERNLHQTRLGFIPSLNASLDFQRQYGTSFDFLSFQRVDRATSYSSPRLSLSTDLFAGFAKHYALRQAENVLRADQLALQNTRENLLTQVMGQFLVLVLDQVDLDVARQRAQTIQQQLERVQVLLNNGAATELELRQLEGQLAAERTNLELAQTRIDRDQMTLEMLMQLDPNEEFVFVLPDTVPEAELEAPLRSPALVTEIALSQMAVAREAFQRVGVAQWQAKLARAQLMPRLSFTAGLSSNFTSNGGITTYTRVPLAVSFNGTVIPITDAAGNPLTQSIPSGVTRTGYFPQIADNFAQFFVFTLQVPIFNGWQARRSYEVAHLQVRFADLNLQQTRDNLHRTVHQAHLDALGALARWQSLKAQVRAFEQAFALTQARYQQGAATFYEFREALNNVATTRLQLRQAMFEAYFRRKVLDFYAGEGFNF